VARIQDNQGIVRVDHRISERDTIYGSYIIDDRRDNFPNGNSGGGSVPLGSGYSDTFRNQHEAITWLHTFTPHVVNEFIFGANRAASLNAKPADTTPPSALGYTNVNPDDPAGAAPPILFSNTFTLGPPSGGPTTIHDVTFHWQDNLSWSRGHHDLKFGTDIRRVRNNFHFDYYNNGSFDFANYQSPFTGDGFADFVAGFPRQLFSIFQSGVRHSHIFVRLLCPGFVEDSSPT
jgi:hypothetical protein